jgi:enoyl-CoA hydratase/carnithine racemase
MGDGTVEIREGDRSIVATISRPSVRNCIDEQVLDGLERALDLAEQNRVRALVLRGSGGHFSAGMDLALVRSLLDDPAAFGRLIGRLVAIANRLESGPFASVAVVEGFALAGGCELLLACDISIASTTARIGDCHLESGLVPGAGGAVRIPRSLTAARSNLLLLTGQTIDGRTAAEWGLVSRCVEPADLDAAVDDLVERLATRSGDAIRTVKELAIHSRGADVGAPEAARFEFERFLDHVKNCADAREGIAAFVEKRKPVFTS